MKAVLLAGGLGTRLSEETSLRPKPMVEVGGKPIIWHIMKIYSAHGVNDFVICCGYKGYAIKEYFSNYFLHTADITFDLANNRTEIHQTSSEPWRVTLVDTGDETMTGGRLKRVRDYIDDDFCFTYGDGVTDADIGKIIALHKAEGKAATLMATQPPGRFGVLEHDGNRVLDFREKPKGEGSWINAGFFVLSPSVFDRLQDDSTVWEQAPLQGLARDDQLNAYFHEGFWHPMDTLRDKHHLESLWNSGSAPWKVW